MEHLQRVWHASRERLPFRNPWFRPPLWDLLVFKLFRPDPSNLPSLYSTLIFHLEYPLVLSRFCLLLYLPTSIKLIVLYCIILYCIVWHVKYEIYCTSTHLLQLSDSICIVPGVLCCLETIVCSSQDTGEFTDCLYSCPY